MQKMCNDNHATICMYAKVEENTLQNYKDLFRQMLLQITIELMKVFYSSQFFSVT